jgi:hypothetical protein
MQEKKERAFRVGIVVLIMLTFFTLGEFLIGAFTEGLWMALFAIAAIKAFFVIRDYMHISRVFWGEEETAE